MSEVQEMQDDEREALISIYEGDTAFKQVNPTTYQYKVEPRRQFVTQFSHIVNVRIVIVRGGK